MPASQTAVSAAGQDAIERGSKAGSEPEPGNVATYDGADRLTQAIDT